VSQQEYYDDARQEAAEIRARIEKLSQELVALVPDGGGEPNLVALRVVTHQIRHLESMLAMALDQGD
jgi:hypothetical protein